MAKQVKKILRKIPKSRKKKKSWKMIPKYQKKKSKNAEENPKISKNLKNLCQNFRTYLPLEILTVSVQSSKLGRDYSYREATVSSTGL